MKKYFLPLMASLLLIACGQDNARSDWKKEIDTRIPMLGHRNWILVVDQAFPSQSSASIDMIYADVEISEAVGYVLDKLKQTGHTAPIVYTDKELQYVTPEMEPGIQQYRKSLDEILVKYGEPKSMLHDSVFQMVDNTSKLFKIMVVKTKTKIAYSSVFIELDCGYWNGSLETKLRESMNK